MMDDLFVSGEVFDNEDYPYTLFKWFVMTSIRKLDTKSSLSSYTSLSQIGLKNTASLKDIGFNLPKNTSLTIDVYRSTNDNLPLPKISELYSLSGTLIAIKGGDNAKCNFIFMSDAVITICNYNTYNSPQVGKWKRLDSNVPLSISASNIGNKLSNILMDGDYYFNSSESPLLTDSPETGALFVSVKTTSIDKIIEVTRNSAFARKYIKQNDNKWVSIPLTADQIPDNQLRVGDFKVGSDGKLYVRVDQSTVKAL
ncbi:hypothetical protein [Morganella morganii]|uniref:hypothetical protein n=1 Tax=Morganella morganii TaxID=582 RepID=UPI001BDAA972|nr:hypothetical protein [Morganella morganii]MBT0494116.1 hypothetical protein [Morganella morganii subsp. morganii]QWL94436.1 hypothetical protein IZ186_06365 [Morganella morganii subsp. morganii]